MKLTEALTILRNQPANGAPFEVLLACGFTALHLEKFLAAEVQQVLPDRRIVTRTGLFGDLPGTIEEKLNPYSWLDWRFRWRRRLQLWEEP